MTGDPALQSIASDHRGLRPVAAGKFLFVAGDKFWVRGVGYDLCGELTDTSKERVLHDLEALAQDGVNTLCTDGVPAAWFLDAAARRSLRVMAVLVPNGFTGFIEDRQSIRRIAAGIRDEITRCAGHPAILGYVLGGRISESTVRWHGHRRIEHLIKRLYDISKATDPEALLTYLNWRATEHLQLPFLDFHCYDVRTTPTEELGGVITRLHNLVGERPLVISGIDADGTAPGREIASNDAFERMSTAFGAGCAGTFLSRRAHCRGAESGAGRENAATDNCGISKSSRNIVREAYAATPFPPHIRWPRISVVVCSFNGAATIRDTLEGLAALRYPDFEVIVVDDGSTDATPDIAASYDFKVISTENRGLSNARNTGWQSASGAIVAYIDDDAYPDPDWLSYLALHFLETRDVGVGGPNIAPPGDGWIADCVANAPGGPVHVLLSDSEAEHIPGCNMAFKREALQAIDGFDGRYRAAGDDVDLCWRLQDRGWKIGFSAAAVVWHHRRNSVRMYWKQQQGYGKAEALLEDKWPEKYNALGHYAWSGRLYGKGLTQALASAGVYRGQSMPAALQSSHPRETGFLASLPLMPEWFILISGLAGLTLLGASWRPLLWTTPILILACAAPLAQAALSAAKAEFPTPSKSGFDHLRRVVLTGLLHLLQPLARLKGRLGHGLTPWRARVRARATWRPADTREFRSRMRLSPDAWRERIAGLAREQQMVVREGEDRDDWDLEVSGGLLGSARLLLAIEDDQTGGQKLRIRSWMRAPRAGVIASFLGLVTIAMAVSQGAWVAAAAIGIGVAALGTGTLLHSGSALSALELLLTKLDEHQRPDPERMTPGRRTGH